MSRKLSQIELHTGKSKKYLSKCGIYKIWFVNDPKNRIYIGSALSEKEKSGAYGFYHRWSSHLAGFRNGNNECPKLRNACKKFGIENVRFEIVDVLKSGYCNSYYEIIEKAYIAKYKCVQEGFNILPNGRNSKGIPCKESAKLAISKANKGERNKMFGKCGGLHHNSKKIYQYDMDGNFVKEWGSIKEASEETNAFNIANVAFGKRKSSGGFMWRFEKVDKLLPHFDKNYALFNKIPFKVCQYDLEENFIREWESSSIAAKTLGLNRTNINCACNGKYKHCGGFKWKYKSHSNNPEHGKFAEYSFKI